MDIKNIVKKTVTPKNIIYLFCVLMALYGFWVIANAFRLTQVFLGLGVIALAGGIFRKTYKTAKLNKKKKRGLR